MQRQQRHNILSLLSSILKPVSCVMHVPLFPRMATGTTVLTQNHNHRKWEQMAVFTVGCWLIYSYTNSTKVSEAAWQTSYYGSFQITLLHFFQIPNWSTKVKYLATVEFSFMTTITRKPGQKQTQCRLHKHNAYTWRGKEFLSPSNGKK